MQVKHLIIEPENREDASGRKIYRVKNTIRNNFIRLGKNETYHLLKVLDSEAMNLELGLDDVEELSEELQHKLEEKFEEWGFLNENDSKPYVSTFDKIKKIHLVRLNVEKVTGVVYPIYNILYQKYMLVILIAMILVNLGVLIFGFQNAVSPSSEVVNTVSLHMGIGSIIGTVIYLFVNIILHEFAHASMCIRYGGKVKEMGIMLFYFTPGFYCDVSDIYTIQDKKKRAIVGIAGILLNLFVGNLLFLAGIIMAFMGHVHLLLLTLAMLTIIMAIYNLIPFVKLDGYWIVTALLGIDNLMDKSVIIAYTCLFSRKNMKRIHMSGFKKFLLSVFGIISLVFHTVFWFYSLYTFQRLLITNKLLKIIIMGFALGLVFIDIVKSLLYYNKLIREDYDRMLMLL